MTGQVLNLYLYVKVGPNTTLFVELCFSLPVPVHAYCKHLMLRGRAGWGICKDLPLAAVLVRDAVDVFLALRGKGKIMLPRRNFSCPDNMASPRRPFPWRFSLKGRTMAFSGIKKATNSHGLVGGKNTKLVALIKVIYPVHNRENRKKEVASWGKSGLYLNNAQMP